MVVLVLRQISIAISSVSTNDAPYVFKATITPTVRACAMFVVAVPAMHSTAPTTGPNAGTYLVISAVWTLVIFSHPLGPLAQYGGELILGNASIF